MSQQTPSLTNVDQDGKEHKETMGKTDAGISNADEINEDWDNPFTNAWVCNPLAAYMLFFIK